MSDAVLPLPREVARTPLVAALKRTLRGWTGRAAADPATINVAAVRELAYRYRETDRGFAADLLCAADRHETTLRANRPGSAADRRR